MKAYHWRIIAGVVMLAFGMLALLQSLNVIQMSSSLWGLVPAVIFILGGVAFLGILRSDRKQWWAVIPGVVLAAIGTLILVTTLLPGLGEAIGGLIVLGGIGAAFWAVYFLERDSWWAIIPAGTLTTLGIISVLPNLIGGLSSSGFLMGALFFLGLAVTFALVALLPPKDGSRGWAWIPAAALLFMALLVTMFADAPVNYLWPIVLILLGIYFLARTFRQPKV